MTDQTTTELSDTDIAIVGMAGRFPGAAGTRELWALLLDGRTGITRFTDDELRRAGVPEHLLADPAYVKAGAVLDDVDLFDPAFFGLSGKEAQLLDPQQRLFLECSWRALEDAGCDPSRFGGLIGIFGGAAWSTYLTNNLLPNKPLVASTGELAIGLGNEKDSLTTRVSHILGLAGPSLGVQSYCSTSLVAVATAATSLAGGECDLALAGGVSVQVPHRVGYLYQEGGMTSPDGGCAAFDESALGTPVGSGVAVVALRRLGDALRDGDRVYAVIRGWAVNNDAGRKVGFTAPGVGGQAAVVAEALASSGLAPGDIDYLEAHGTGTALGDAAELAALQKVFDGQTCLIGSVKTNLGHLDRAAGATGLIKAALSLHHGQLPATLNFRTPNRQLRLGGATLDVVTERRDWARGERPRRAGVSAFGIGGTNAHVVLEEAPYAARETTGGTGVELLVWSGRTASAADRLTAGLARRLAGDTSGGLLADVAYTLRRGRTAFEHRRFLVAADAAEAAVALGAGSGVAARPEPRVDRAVRLLVPDQCTGLGWAEELHAAEPRFRDAVEECLARAAEVTGAPIPSLAASPPQVAAFAAAYGLGRWLQAHGVGAAAVLGHRTGAAVAACLAGALPLREALAVAMTAAGPTGPAELAAWLRRHVTFSAPSIAVWSNLTGEPLDAAAAQDPGTWARLLTAADFAAADALSRDEDAVLLELGADGLLSSTVGRPSTRGPSRPADLTLFLDRDAATARHAAYALIGRLWLAGVPVDWTRFQQDRPLRKVDVPGHPFDRARYWIDPPAVIPPSVVPPPVVPPAGAGVTAAGGIAASEAGGAAVSGAGVTAILGADATHTGAGVAPTSGGAGEVFLTAPVWEPVPGPAPAPWPSTPHVLLLAGDAPAGRGLRGRLAELGVPCTVVRPGAGLRLSGDGCAIDPDRPDHYADLVRWAGGQAGDRPVLAMHLWALDARDPARSAVLGFASVAALARALGESALDGPQMLAVTRGGCAAAPGDVPVPEQAAVAPVCLVARQEYPGLLCRAVDLGAAEADAAGVADALLEEARRPAHDVAVAIRGGVRLAARHVPVPAPAAPRSAIRAGGTYLITGGLGDVGPLVATHLAERGAARVVLTSRTGRAGTPPALRRLAAAGAEVEVAVADVTDAARMRELVAGLTRRHGRVDGIVHAAGETGADGFVALRDLGAALTARHFAPKLGGARVLRGVLEELPATEAPDFCLLFSSVAAVLGGIGFAAYAAANAALTALAEAADAGQGPTRWLAVQWDTWAPTARRLAGGPGAAFAAYAMTPDQSTAALDGALASACPAMTATAADPARRIAGRLPEPAAAPAPEVQRFPRPDLAQPFVPPAPGAERRLAAIWAEQLGLREVGAQDNFFDLGGTSLLGLQLLTTVAREFGTRLPAVALFEAPTVRSLAMLLQPPPVTPPVTPVTTALAGHGPEPAADTAPVAVPPPDAATAPAPAKPVAPAPAPAKPVAAVTAAASRTEATVRDQRIAIVGMSGRFPGAANVAELWRNLLDGTESISFFSPEELAEAGVDPELSARPDYVPARPVLDGIADFDAGFFGFSPRAAALTDPQQRVFLEVCWEALEHAGYGAPGGRGRVGVFGGTNISTYFLHSQQYDLLAAGEVNDYEVVMGNDKDALTTTVSYTFDLTGPSVAVQTFCSTSLVAAHLACRSLRAGECELALAGGVSIRVPNRVGHLYQEGGMASPDGHVRAFDARARGSMFGDGAAVVVLKPLADALRDGDTVWAVIRGSAMNNDGAMKVGYTAPSVAGQATVIREALADAGVRPGEVGYVEAHGTGTPLGDPIEVAALTRAFGPDVEHGSCALGSVKTNVGHLDRAAGVTGLIKAALAVRTGVLPRQLHFTEPNPEIDFAGSPFYVQTELTPFPGGPDRPRLAGVNSLGMGGTNVHMVVEQPPAAGPAEHAGHARRYHALLLSARGDEAAEQACRRLGERLLAEDAPELADAAFTLQTGRAVFGHRRALVTGSLQEAGASLAGLPGAPGPMARTDATRERRAAFVFAGVGEQYPGMVTELYRREPVFRAALGECAEVIRECDPRIDTVGLLTGARAGGPDLAALLGRAADAGSGDERAAALRRTDVAQPLVFAAEYAIARTLMAWGVQPELMIGYSLGEYVAACLAGVLSLRDALRLVTHRAALISAMPAGAMLAVPLSPARLRGLAGPLEPAGLDVAVVNGPDSLVVAGAVTAVRDLAARLTEQGVASRELDTTHAFHSRRLAPLRAELTGWIAENVTLRPPVIPYLSNVTGGPADADLVGDPAYWARHMCETVRFDDAIRAVVDRADLAVVEIGPGWSLGAMIRSSGCPRERWPLIVSTLPAAHDPRPDDLTLTDALARLWLTGVDVDWQAMHGPTGGAPARRRVPLPTYPFQRRRYWLDGASGGRPRPAGAPEPAQEGGGSLAEAGRLPRLDERDWLYAPAWRQVPSAGAAGPAAGSWLVFTCAGSAAELTAAVRDAVAASGGDTVMVHAGPAYAEDGERFRVRPGSLEDTVRLLRELRARGFQPDRVLHLWTLADRPDEQEHVRLGFETLTALARAAGEVGWGDWALDVVTRATQQVLPGEELRPARATVTGPVRVIPLEYPRVRTRLIDVTDAADPCVLGALLAGDGEQVVAVRHGLRWACDHVRLPDLAGGGDPLRDEGVYLITGGLGGIGLAMARELARERRARLVLFGRTGLPPRPRWDAIVAGAEGTEGAGGDADERTRRRVTAVRELLDAGAEVEVVAGDVSNPSDVEKAVGRAFERFGALHGVFHAAGVPGIGLMQLKDPADFGRALAPKVAGTEALAAALRTGESDEIALDFLVLFSSITSVTGGGPGQVDYCAANAYLDAFARARAATGRRTVAVGWGEWRWNAWSAGLDGYDPALREFFTRHRDRFGIGFDEGWRALRRGLSAGLPHVIVSTQDFGSIVRLSTAFDVDTVRPGGEDSGARYPRPELATAYAAPQTATERIVAGAWGEVLRLDRVGVADNFFELGGNSLIGVDLIGRLRVALDLAELPPHVLYEAPTVEALARLADTLRDGAGGDRPGADGRRQDRADQRRVALRNGAPQRRRKR
ncbi:SDR family NAD(P)-dependent oxidoreductase [Sphaerisporangium sp. NPDC005289]|uniref:type I polyketide synthase n=1 Tax=Sphaerisporangium sp. NPDC005289 TaxID=3155247 RepID=UPI0033AF1052